MRLPAGQSRRPLGKAPYTDLTCSADGQFVDRISQIVEQLREAAVEEDWTVDWDRFNSLLDQAAASGKAANYAEAVRQYCQAISFMVEQLKLQRNSGNDSGMFG